MTTAQANTTKTMKAAYFEQRDDLANLVPTYGEVSQPTPGEGQVLVRVRATSIMPSEVTWPETWETEAGLPRTFPIILGHEFAGVVAALGDDVNGLDVGDEIYGMNDWDKNGAQAEYCLTRPVQVARMPRSIGYAKVAATPISALTAWQALVEHGHVAPGQRVLIHGGSGSVGAFAVQIARSLGAYVIATASTRNVELARSFGADEVIDYSVTPFEDAARDIDLVLDTVGHDTQERSWGVLKPDGLLISIVQPISEESASAHRARGLYFIVRADGEQLARIAELVDAGRLEPLISEVFPLTQAREAYAFATTGHRGGKTILHIAY